MGEKDNTERLRKAANQAIHLEVAAGIRPHANQIPCCDCGHVYSVGQRRHEWHHHLGYQRQHWFTAIVLCTLCHGKKSAKAKLTHCVRGHEFTNSNTYINKNGTRRCRSCQRVRDKARKGRLHG